jgi:hypothetical protein
MKTHEGLEVKLHALLAPHYKWSTSHHGHAASVGKLPVNPPPGGQVGVTGIWSRWRDCDIVEVQPKIILLPAVPCIWSNRHKHVTRSDTQHTLRKP